MLPAGHVLQNRYTIQTISAGAAWGRFTAPMTTV